MNPIKASVFVLLLVLSIANVAAVVTTTSVTRSPASESGSWSNADDAYSSNNVYASENSNKANNRWYNYNFAIPSNAVITSVTIRLDAKKSSSFSSRIANLNVSASGNGGTSYGPNHPVLNLSSSETTYIANVTNDLAWTPSMLSNSSLRVNVTCYLSGMGSNDCQLDWIPMTVQYHVPVCGDGVINQGSEQCDGSDGVGAHQSCDSSCNLVNEAYCGDGNVDSGESCDAGASNGNVCVPGYNATCNYCSGVCQTVNVNGGYCGDGFVQGPEACDGGASCDESCQEIVEVPEFGAIAATAGLAGLGAGYLLIRRKRK